MNSYVDFLRRRLHFLQRTIPVSVLIYIICARCHRHRDMYGDRDKYICRAAHRERLSDTLCGEKNREEAIR